jgi:hypothetical protein
MSFMWHLRCVQQIWRISVHRVCKAGNKKLLQVFLEHGASVQIANDYGRTPLHEVFITKPCFINFEQVLKQDPI